MKKILLSLFVGLIGFIGFGYCGNIYFSSSNINGFYPTNFSSSTYKQGSFSQLYSCSVPSNCYYYVANYNSSYSLSILSSSELNSLANGSNYISVLGSSCSKSFNCSNVKSKSISSSDCPLCDDPYSSSQCQEIYSLIPIEEIDINYCVGNGLCPNESGTGDFTGDLQFSNIYINNILHPGRQNIFVTIPDYITWDYAFTGDDFNIYVGSGYDEEYINSIIKINSYRPTTTDFSDIFISGLTLIFPYIVVTLFIVFVWRLLKRIFK